MGKLLSQATSRSVRSTMQNQVLVSYWYGHVAYCAIKRLSSSSRKSSSGLLTLVPSMEMFSFTSEENIELIKMMYLKPLDCLCLHTVKLPLRQLLQHRDIHAGEQLVDMDMEKGSTSAKDCLERCIGEDTETKKPV
jgi:hypothetical protein